MLKTTIQLYALIIDELLAANEIGGVKSDNKSIKITEKLSKNQKLFKSKKLSKKKNLPKFATKKVGSGFLTLNAKMAFNHLRLIFTKAPILCYFDLKCHIWI